MKTENILSLKAAADMYHERTLKKNAEIFVSTNIENIVHQQEFKEFTLEDVLAVLESRKSKVRFCVKSCWFLFRDANISDEQ